MSLCEFFVEEAEELWDLISPPRAPGAEPPDPEAEKVLLYFGLKDVDQLILTNVSCPPVHCYLLKLCVEKDVARRCRAADEGYDTSPVGFLFEQACSPLLNHRENRTKRQTWVSTKIANKGFLNRIIPQQ